MEFNRREKVRTSIIENYSQVASKGAKGGCGCSPGNDGSCCGGAGGEYSQLLGYSDQELAEAPDGANLGLGCGNPQAIAALRPGERVLDLGSGAGFDAFLAARKVGPSGRVTGVDMTPAMIEKARANARKGGFGNVEFIPGEIEKLPVESGTIDVIISNCVINLSTDKQRVFTEAFRVLVPGGRLAISDIVTTSPLPEAVKADLRLHSACIAGASTVSELRSSLEAAGFEDISIELNPSSAGFIKDWHPDRNLTARILSAQIRARKSGSAPGV